MTDLIYRGVRHMRQSHIKQAPVSRRLIYRGVRHNGLLQTAAWSPVSGIDMCYRGVRYRSRTVAGASDTADVGGTGSVAIRGLAPATAGFALSERASSQNTARPVSPVPGVTMTGPAAAVLR